MFLTSRVSPLGVDVVRRPAIRVADALTKACRDLLESRLSGASDNRAACGDVDGVSVFSDWHATDGSAVSALTYLDLFPREQRLVAWSCVNDYPTVKEVLLRLVATQAAGYAERAARFWVIGDRVRVVSNSCEWAISLGELLAAPGSIADMRFEYPQCRSDLPSGFCYLDAVLPNRVAMAAIYGDSPRRSDLDGFLRSDTRVDVVGDHAHVSAAGSSLLRDLPRNLDFTLGGPVCWNLERGAEPQCVACAGIHPVDVSAVRGVPDGADYIASVLRATDHVDVDVFSVLGVADLRGQVLKDRDRVYGLSTRSARDTLVVLDVDDDRALMPDGPWSLWVDVDEIVSTECDGFKPSTYGGGLYVGRGPVVVRYTGKRKRLIVRRFSDVGWTQFCHCVLRVGPGGQVSEGFSRFTSHTRVNRLFIPGSGSIGRSRNWRVGHHPLDLLPGRMGSSGFSTSVYCRLYGNAGRALEIGSYPNFAVVDGNATFGNSGRVRVPSVVCVWSPDRGTTDIEIGKDTTCTLHSYSYATRKLATRWLRRSVLLRDKPSVEMSRCR